MGSNQSAGGQDGLLGRLASYRERAATTLSTRLRPDGLLGRPLRWVHHHLPRSAPARPLEQVIAAFGAARPRATFVQVGAHDGTQIDPLRHEILRRHWRGVLVEPVPYVFRRLAENYGAHGRLTLENAAIADHDGTQQLYFLRESADGDDVWKWYDALASFRREVVLSHVNHIPDIEERIESVDVPCLTFDSLCRKHALDAVDLVQIDTEGYDYEVVRGIDLDRLALQVVMYEHLHLGDDDRSACEALLTSHGFALASDGMDTLAVRRSLLEAEPSVAAAWDGAVRELRPAS